jgi:uncharacterized membrane protein YkoI
MQNIKTKLPEKYFTYRYTYSTGKKDKNLDCKFKEFNSLTDAIKYAHKYAKGLRFAEVQIENEAGKILYVINNDGVTHDYRK